MSGPLVVVGDALLDVDIDGSAERLCPEAPVPVVDVAARSQRPGGAGLAAMLAADDVDDVVLICALADDEPGRALLRLLTDRVQVADIPLRGGTVCKTRVRAGGQSIVRLDSGDGRAGAEDPLPPRVCAALQAADTVLVADYGRGVAAHRELRELLGRMVARVPVVWDPHPRGPKPVPGVGLATPNDAEAAAFACADTVAARASQLVDGWQAGAVAVTLGAEGAVVVGRGGEPVAVAAPTGGGAAHVPFDTCGAGDCFASTAARALMAGADVYAAVRAAAAAASAFVAAGGASALSSPVQPTPVVLHPAEDAFALARRIRRDGRRLVATGGCFDLLHPGHISLLREARRLGDALIVCLNSDESVRRAKGRGRPVVRAEDRARVLSELESVDAVAIFDEVTPTAVLDRLRPHIWVKGDDYAGTELPEAATVTTHGGDIVFVPTLRGYSTTRMVAAVRDSA